MRWKRFYGYGKIKPYQRRRFVPSRAPHVCPRIFSRLQIEDIRESVDYYIENNQDADFVEDESIYENINLSSVQLGVAGGVDSDDDNDDDGGSDLDLSSDDDDAAAVDDDDDYDVQSDSVKEEPPSAVPTRAAVSAPSTPSKKPQSRVELDVAEESATAKPAPPKNPIRQPGKPVEPKEEPKVTTTQEKKPLTTEPEKTDLPKLDQAVKRPVAVAQAAAPSPAAPVVEEEKRDKLRPSLAPAEKVVAAPAAEPSTSHLVPSMSSSLTSNAPQMGTISLAPSIAPAPATTAAGVPLLLASLQNSFNNVPESMDSSRPQQYKPKTPFSTPVHYPAAPAAVFDNPAVFEKFDTDTLFFIFYYQQGTYQQYLAAKELKRQSWRYHKKYLTWFQRHEEPKEITADYEQGTYVYFDYETGWCQRKKTEFTFQYRYLEDKDLV
eukprot:TRINITY_DN325_c0_g1_i2.p1 TRINITY_DN325_c0_g1~~TRINITY_DN325_c0_g1_i2.p1  ORF type:complete len:436 (-),score=90.21 TRINITY_DN325_c0_g1_i2:85-1392(-)